MILIRIDRNSIKRQRPPNSDDYTYDYLWVPALCHYCGIEVDIEEIEYDTGASQCPHCEQYGTFEDFKLETITEALRDMEKK